MCSGIRTPQQLCVPFRGSYTFDLIIYSDLLAGDETISITANEIPSTFAVLLGRKTIKQNNISLKCFRFFSNLETGESLRGFVSYNLYATMSPDPQLVSASFSALIAAGHRRFADGRACCRMALRKLLDPGARRGFH